MNIRLVLSNLVIVMILLTACQNDTTQIKTDDGIIEMSTDEYLKTLGEIYLYGYPLVLMDLTKSVTTNIESPHPERPLAPINQLGHFRRFPDHTLTAVVKPNVDTYYSIAWLDLAKEPLVLSMPATDRYYLLPFLDAYSNVFASPGTRTTGTDALTVLIVGPDWKGDIPNGFTVIQAPTEMVWLLGRIQVNDDEDGQNVVWKIQDQMSLVPLSGYGNPDYTATLGIVKPENADIIPVKTIQEFDVPTYFNRMSELMLSNKPTIQDSVIVSKMKNIGLEAGKPFELSSDNLILKTKIKALPKFVHNKMAARRSEPDSEMLTNGWGLVKEGIGKYGIDYARRAYVDFVGLGACIPEDAIYPSCAIDVNGDPLEGRKNYQIHFDADQLPPVKAFWSLTAYNADEFLVKNEINRYALGDRDQLRYNADGSLDIFIQAKSPEPEFHSNWLPVPDQGPFYLTMRLYWPKQEVLDGDWEIPFVMPREQ